VTHLNYNPEGITSHNIVPGLLAIVLFGLAAWTMFVF
jgi:hypothetical protein